MTCSRVASIIKRQFLIFYDFLNGFMRFEDDSISAGGKFIYRMSEEDWCVCCTMVPISYIL